MRRSGVGLAEVADLHNLGRAFHAAARGKRGRPDVEAFRADLDRELAALRAEILDDAIAVGRTRVFRIRDPKPRTIHAPCFRERVLHHAIMARIGPVLDRTLVDDCYACREGKGSLAAVRRAAEHSRRHPAFAQVDIRAYFASLDHGILLSLLERKLKDEGLLSLVFRIIDSHHDTPGRGLPIGALTSQHFANFYLAGADRLLLEGCNVAGYVRYMDDLVWWASDRTTARASLEALRSYLRDSLRLEIKLPFHTGPSRSGLTFCGYRIMPDRLLLSRRRKRRYAEIRDGAERAYLSDSADGRALQAGYAAALALTVHADASAWRRVQLRRRPVEAALDQV